MGYDLHITRAEHWSENKGREITLEEWLSLIAADPELKPDPDNGIEVALWSGPSRYAEPWFEWWEGNISTKNPDRAMVAKMLQMAKTLNAHVQGDDGEIYDSLRIGGV